MSTTTRTEIIFFVTLAIALARDVPAVRRLHGKRVFESEKHLAPERWIYRVARIDPDAEQTWGVYLRSVLAFSLVSVLVLYAFLRVQQAHLFGHPYAVPQMHADQAFNTAASFVTNTNWQSYSGESALGYAAQAAGLTVQNFASAAVGIAVAIALVRGFTRNRTDRLGNFWVDLTRICVRILLPISFVFAIVFVGAGAIETWAHYQTVTGPSGASQTIPGGPIASQEAIKELGTNGGGPFNANSAHPFENPTVWTNWLQVYLILAIGFSLPRAFGRMVKDKRQGLAIVAVMAIIFTASTAIIFGSQAAHHGTVPTAVGASTEGTETRFGVPDSSIFASATTATSTGAVDSFHDSYTSLGGAGTAAEHDVRRGRARRHRIGSVRDPDPGGAERVHRRPHGRPNAGVPRQEDRRPGSEVRLALPADDTDAGAGRNRAGDGASGGARRHAQLRPARPVRGAVRLHLGGQQQRLRVRRHQRQHRLVQHARSASSCCSAGCCRSSSSSAWPARWPSRRPVPASAGTLAHPSTAVHRTADRRDGHRRRAHLLPGHGAGTARGRTSLMVTPTAEATAARRARVQGGLLDPKQLLRSLPDALKKLNPMTLWRNPVMFIVEIGSVFTTVLAIRDHTSFAIQITVWLWLTVLFANLAEAVAEGRGKAQAEALRRAKTDTVARRVINWDPGMPAAQVREEPVPAPQLAQGDIVVCEAGDFIPGDGDVIDGVASVDESAITGESAPVIRESGGDRSSVTGGTKVLSDRIVIRITQKPGESFIDRMIALVEGASRQKTPNEIALNILLASLTIIFLLAVATLQPLAIFSKVNQPGIPEHVGARRRTASPASCWYRCWSA